MNLSFINKTILEYIDAFQVKNELANSFGTPKCEIKKSKAISGELGLFACCDLFPGQIITIYPPHYAIFYDKNVKPEHTINLYNPKEDFDPLEINKISNTYGLWMNEECIDSDINFKDVLIVGLPSMISDPVFLGHMINDFRYTGYQKNVAITQQELFGKMCRCITASFHIKKGSELFLDYGSGYWSEYAISTRSK